MRLPLRTVARARPRMPASKQLLLPVALLLLVFGGGTDLHAHIELQSSTPAAGARLDASPEVLSLTFTEPLELGLSSLSLNGPEGPVPLGTLATSANRETLTAQLLVPLGRGSYRVAWQAVGRDGHPIRGEYGFVVEGSGEPGTPLGPPAAVLMDDPPAAAPFGPQSPLYAAVRWMMYVGILGTLGGLGFALLLASPRLREPALSRGFRSAATTGAATLGLLAVLVLAVALPLRLQAQSHALFGVGISGDRFGLLLRSTWGLAWLAQLAGAVLSLIGFLVARRGRRFGWLLAGAGAIMLVSTPGVSGHASAVPDWRVLALVGDALHVLGAGIWIGTLFTLLVVALPALGREPVETKGASLTRLLHAFNPLALGSAGLVFATGVLAATFQLSAISDLWASAYGRLLLAKLFVVLLVGALGAYNWRSARGRHLEGRRFARSGGAETAAAMLVIMLTSVLVAVPPPARSSGSIDTPLQPAVEP